MPDPIPATVTPDGTAFVIAERARINQIDALGTRFKKPDLARSLIDSGKSIDEARTAFLEAIGEKQIPLTGREAEIGLTEKETKRFSFLRAINALANPTNKLALDAARFEMECSDAVAATLGKSARGIMVPIEVLQASLAGGLDGRRDLLQGTATAGGHTVQTDMMSGDFITLLRNRMALTGLGVRTLGGLTGNIAIPRMTAGATAYWVAENTASTESQQAFDQVTMTPKTVGAFTDISRRLLLQSSIDVEGLVRSDLATVLALAIDLAGVTGTGASNQPRGIINTVGIGSVAGGTNGLLPTWGNIVDLESAVANGNADMGTMGYLTNSRVRGRLKQTQKFATTNGDPIWENDGTMNGYKSVVSNQVPNNLVKGASGAVCSAIVFGNFADLIMGMWGTLDLMLDPYTGSTAGTIRVVAMQDVDVAVRQPASFAAMLDALTV